MITMYSLCLHEFLSFRVAGSCGIHALVPTDRFHIFGVQHKLHLRPNLDAHASLVQTFDLLTAHVARVFLHVLPVPGHRLANHVTHLESDIVQSKYNILLYKYV